MKMKKSCRNCKYASIAGLPCEEINPEIYKKCDLTYSEWRPMPGLLGELTEEELKAIGFGFLPKEPNQHKPGSLIEVTKELNRPKYIEPDYYGYSKNRQDVIDFCIKHDLDFLQGNIVQYVVEFRKKNGLEDLYKARTYLDRLIEAEE